MNTDKLVQALREIADVRPRNEFKLESRVIDQAIRKYLNRYPNETDTGRVSMIVPRGIADWYQITYDNKIIGTITRNTVANKTQITFFPEKDNILPSDLIVCIVENYCPNPVKLKADLKEKGNYPLFYEAS